MRNVVAVLLLAVQILLIAEFLWHRSKKKSAEAHSIRSSERLRMAMQTGKSVGWDWDIASGRDFLFGDLWSFFGIPSDTYTASVQEFFSYVHPDDRQRVTQAVADARQNHQLYSTEFRIALQDRPTRWVAARGEFQYAPDGTATRMLGLAVDVTDKKHVEDALKKSQEKYSKAFRESPLIVTLTSVKDDRFIEVNDTHGRITGWPRDEVIGRTPIEVGIWVDPGQRAEFVKEVSTGRTLRNFEFRFRTRAGAARTGLLSADLIEINDEPCILSVTADITERRATFAALRESEERFRLAMNNVAAGVYTIDLHGLVTYVNPAAEAMFGWTSAELLGRKMHDVTHYKHPDDSPFPAADCAGLQVLNEGIEVREYEDLFIRKDGEFFPVVYSASPLRTDGKIMGVVVGFRDDTHRRKAERALRESEERFRLVAQSAPVAIWMSDVNNTCVYINQRWTELTGRSFEAQLGYGWTENIHPEDLERVLESIRRPFEERELFRAEYRLRRYDGEYVWILDSGAPRFNPDGSFAGYIGSAVDITDIKLAEQVLSTMNQRLIEAHEAERAWIAGELHDDIGQRLVLLALNLGSLERALPSSPPALRNDVEQARRQLESLGNDILSLSRNVHPSKPRHLGLAKAAASFCTELSSKNVEVDFRSEDIPPDLPEAVSLCLYRVLQEALQNGIKHSGSRRFQVVLSGGNEIHLAVHDSGIGFDPVVAMKGPGIGLNSMKERLKLVNGSLAIESRPAHGTTVHARVPLNPLKKAQSTGV